MNREAFFQLVRRFVEEHAREDRPGIIAANQVVKVGSYEFAIEGRGRGIGYVTVECNGNRIASEFAQHNIWDNAAAEAALDVIEGFTRDLAWFAATRAKIVAAHSVAFSDDPATLVDVADGYQPLRQEPSEECPVCRSRATAEFVDNGFGPYAVQASPFHCENCGWIDDDYSPSAAGAPGSGWERRHTMFTPEGFTVLSRLYAWP